MYVLLCSSGSSSPFWNLRASVRRKSHIHDATRKPETNSVCAASILVYLVVLLVAVYEFASTKKFVEKKYIYIYYSERRE